MAHVNNTTEHEPDYGHEGDSEHIHHTSHIVEDAIHLSSLGVALDIDGVTSVINSCEYVVRDNIEPLLNAIHDVGGHFDIQGVFINGSSIAICIGIIVVSGTRIFIHCRNAEKINWTYVLKELTGVAVTATTAVLAESTAHMVLHVVLSITSATVATALSVAFGAIAGAYLGWNVGKLLGEIYQSCTGKKTNLTYWSIAGLVLIGGAVLAASICCPPVGIAVAAIATTAIVIKTVRYLWDRFVHRKKHNKTH